MEASSGYPPNQNPKPPLHPVTAAPYAAAAVVSAAAPAPAPAPAPELPQEKKRKLEDGGFYDTNYFKIRSIIRDLRPLFIEVIGAPDVEKSKAADEIKKRMKIMVELSKQQGNAAVFTGKSADPLMAHPLARTKEELCTGLPEVLQAQQSQTRKVPSVSDNLMKEALKRSTCISGKLQQEVPQGQKVPQGSQFQNSDTVIKEASERDNIPRKTAMSQQKVAQGPQSQNSDTVMKEASEHDNIPRKTAMSQQKVPQGPQSQNSDTVMKEASERDSIPRKTATSQQKVPQGPQSQNSDTAMKEASERDNIPRKTATSQQKVPQGPQSQNSDTVMKEALERDNIPRKTAKSQQKVPQSSKVARGSSEVKIPGLKELRKKTEENLPGTYVVGGSPFGWNFLLYPGTEPVYYGVTKASALARRSAAK